MKKIIITLASLAALLSCRQSLPEPEFWLGADIGWCTEYESKGYKFYNKEGQERECTALMKELGLNEKDYWWYMNLRKYGGTKHAGFGLGFERIIMYLTGVSNIRDVLPYPRTVGNAEY